MFAFLPELVKLVKLVSDRGRISEEPTSLRKGKKRQLANQSKTSRDEAPLLRLFAHQTRLTENLTGGKVEG